MLTKYDSSKPIPSQFTLVQDVQEPRIWFIETQTRTTKTKDTYISSQQSQNKEQMQQGVLGVPSGREPRQMPAVRWTPSMTSLISFQTRSQMPSKKVSTESHQSGIKESQSTGHHDKPMVMRRRSGECRAKEEREERRKKEGKKWAFIVGGTTHSCLFRKGPPV